MDLLQKLKYLPLSNGQLKTLTGCPILLYSELSNFQTLNDIFLAHPDNSCFGILYLSSPHYGHFCSVIKTNIDDSLEIIEFFDPYGYKPDVQLDFNTDDTNESLRQDGKILSALLIESPYELSFNNYDFQGRASDVQTCGFQCAMRIKLREFSLKEYKKIIDILKEMTGFDTNEIILTYMLHFAIKCIEDNYDNS